MIKPDWQGCTRLVLPDIQEAPEAAVPKQGADPLQNTTQADKVRKLGPVRPLCSGKAAMCSMVKHSGKAQCSWRKQAWCMQSSVVCLDEWWGHACW